MDNEIKVPVKKESDPKSRSSLKDKLNTSKKDFFQIKDKEEFYSKYETLSNENLTDLEKEICNQFSFYPIKEKNSNKIGILTKERSLKGLLVKSKNNDALKVLYKYALKNEQIIVCSESIYFDLVDTTSVLNKQYTDEDAKQFFLDILTDSSRKMASDIHIAWGDESISIKYRIDGKLIRQPARVGFELGNALKNIFVNKSGESEYEENEVAGHIGEVIDNIRREYRVSIGPTVKGYLIVIRLESSIDKNSTFEQWGYSPKAISLLRKMYDFHHGIILVTGATGSGKSTLLYTTIIEKINSCIGGDEPEILTVEDPVEIQIDGINQVQVNVKGSSENWMTFTRAIKMFLRQDPDLIIVGEIRDKDVAIQAVTAAKTGHLTYSTLHTNDVKGTFTRLHELGVDYNNIEDGVRGVVSQRLVQKLCQNCKIKKVDDSGVFYERNLDGCSNCRSSNKPGYIGRVPAVEIAILGDGPGNYKMENFLEYYPLEENIIYFLEEGLIDKEEAAKFIHINEGSDLVKRKNILDVWNKETRDKNGENIFPVYQPIINKQGYVLGYDCLIRMKNLDGEIVNPSFFLEMTKEMGLYQRLTMHLIEKIIDEAKKSTKVFFINIDEENVNDDSFLDELYPLLKEHDLVDRIALELDFDKKYKPFLERCNDLGIKISIDNFNGNISDLVFILRSEIKIEYLKTNFEFMEGVNKEEVWIQDYLAMIRKIEVKIIANFIENKDIIGILSSNNNAVDFYQGYGIQRPSEKISTK